MGDLRERNGVVVEDSPLSDHIPVGAEVWARAERVIQEIIGQVQPTVVSEERRREVIDYVQRLIRNCLGCEVFPFGSVPLKMYLPDGDIDLTAFVDFNSEEALANDVYSVLAAEDCNPAAECIVKDVQYIRAEVKLVKCLVQNIVVDISFNQIGGLCTLCFLEQIDRRIGKDHLFKRSIILIKAWCYYESRILGAHHGLISTYALEMLVLYIFHLFHSSLNGPLAVLYKFLDYYNKFDWENLCVSLHGPVPISSLPEIVAEKPGNGVVDLLLSGDFLKECVDMFSVPSRGNEMSSRTFVQKHLNIIDPLKENNNLGRSVSKGNFYRIRSAFSLGARKLRQILLQPEENVSEELRKFFGNTLERHGKVKSSDVHDPHSTFSSNWLDHRLESINSSGRSAEICDSGSRFFDDAEDVGTSAVEGLRTKNDAHESLEGKSPLLHAHHLYFSQRLGNGKTGDGDLNGKKWPSNRCPQEDNISSGSLRAHDMGIGLLTRQQEDDHLLGFSDSENCSLDWPMPLRDLSGDYDSHVNSWQYGQWWYSYVSGRPIEPMHLLSSPLFPRKNPRDSFWHSTHFGQNSFANIDTNGVIPRLPFFPLNRPIVHGGAAASGMEEFPKARGTGTYFPITKHNSYRERPLASKALKSPRNNGRAAVSRDRDTLAGSNHEQSETQSTVSQDGGNPRSLDFHDETSTRGKVTCSNGLISPSERFVEFSLLGESPPETPWPGRSRPPTARAPAQAMKTEEPQIFIDDDRISAQSYHLKDEDDFPPLSA
ncbi:hypothetical protein Nepgr_030542 [Nepenthes gracilis]|uniref:Polymerase nucleotidyl transferase domain-containing protein n=1 Tax=Nepenthes gracilis TaxID=150966 RepID=A0AAD3TGH0_NEPGR|nr:hypothetical protein Nepgr_030542 [Nepenthes gracilis]